MYGSPQRALRQVLWDEIKNISTDVTGPWCAVGDFNAILKHTEKDGGRGMTGTGVCSDFQSCLVDCGLEDMDFKGCPFTWHRNDLHERLDRAVVNM